MNIQDIKVAIAANAGITITKLDLSTQLDEQKQPTEWVAYWDNDKRVRITMHQEVMEQIKADPKMEGLAFKKEVMVPADANKASYIQYVVITPKSIVASF